jgi:hypothetical protein
MIFIRISIRWRQCAYSLFLHGWLEPHLLGGPLLAANVIIASSATFALMSMFLVVAAPLVSARPLFVAPQTAKNHSIYRSKNHAGELRRAILSLGAAPAHNVASILTPHDNLS